MTHQAALLLAKDFQVSTPVEASNVPKAPAPTINPAPEPMFPLMPIADVLVTERRICKACGSVSEAQSDKVHRLLSSCEGDPFKRVLRPRKAEELPLDIKLNHLVVVEAAHCACCWQQTHMWAEACDIRPKRPKPKGFTLTAMGIAMEDAKRQKLAKKETGKKIAELPLDQALDML